MFLKTILFIIVALVSCLATAASDENWVEVSRTEHGVYAIKKGSLEFTATKGGESVILVLGRAFDLKTSEVSFEKWYVTGTDCGKEMGPVVTLDMSGNYKFENDFVFSGGSVASSIAEVICLVGLDVANKQNSKSL